MDKTTPLELTEDSGNLLSVAFGRLILMPAQRALNLSQNFGGQDVQTLFHRELLELYAAIFSPIPNELLRDALSKYVAGDDRSDSSDGDIIAALEREILRTFLDRHQHYKPPTVPAAAGMSGADRSSVGGTANAGGENKGKLGGGAIAAIVAGAVAVVAGAGYFLVLRIKAAPAAH